MMPLLRSPVVIAIAACWLLPPATATAEQAGVKRAPAAHANKTAHVRKTGKASGHPSNKTSRSRRWTGYGFLPGYRQPPALTDWRDRSPKHNRVVRRDGPRYWSYDGRVYYGWGGAGVHRGRWNGGSFGPCYASTPIGMMWTCGR